MCRQVCWKNKQHHREDPEQPQFGNLSVCNRRDPDATAFPGLQVCSWLCVVLQQALPCSELCGHTAQTFFPYWAFQTSFLIEKLGFVRTDTRTADFFFGGGENSKWRKLKQNYTCITLSSPCPLHSHKSILFFQPCSQFSTSDTSRVAELSAQYFLGLWGMSLWSLGSHCSQQTSGLCCTEGLFLDHHSSTTCVSLTFYEVIPSQCVSSSPKGSILASVLSSYRFSKHEIWYMT